MDTVKEILISLELIVVLRLILGVCESDSFSFELFKNMRYLFGGSIPHRGAYPLYMYVLFEVSFGRFLCDLVKFDL